MTNGKLRILLVEDHSDTLKLYEQLLRLEGYSVSAADSFAAAVCLAEKESFDLLICDLGLPDGSGTPLLEHLWQRTPGVVGIVVSGHARADDISRSLQAGYCLHLSKPIQPQHLLDAISRCLDSSRPTGHPGSGFITGNGTARIPTGPRSPS